MPSFLSFCRRLCGVKSNKVREKIEEELSHYYDPTRYCRLRIGDTLAGRYHVLGKLGWGQFSTVWFAKDQRCDEPMKIRLASLIGCLGAYNGCRSKYLREHC